MQTESLWPGAPGFEPLSPMESGLLLFFGESDPVLKILAMLVYVTATVLLVIKTRVPGRYLLLLAPLLPLAVGLVQMLRFPPGTLMLGSGLFDVVLIYWSWSAGALLACCGYARLVWSVVQTATRATSNVT